MPPQANSPSWEETDDGALALVIVLDQFPRNMFRGDARTFSTDDNARAVADRAIARGVDKRIDPGLVEFLYMPFMHSEQLADQERCVALFQSGGRPDNLKFARSPCRHHPPVRPFSASQSDARAHDERGGTGFSRWRRVLRLMTER